VAIRSFINKSRKEKDHVQLAIQHGEERSLVEVFRATTLLCRALGNREFVALEVSEYLKRLAAFGRSDGLEESIQGEEAARELRARLAIR
jgi:hypothetical protein